MRRKYHHVTWREKFKRLDENSRDIRKEFLLSQALIYFLGSALVAQATPPSQDFGFMTPVFEFVVNGRFILAYILLVLALFFFYTGLISKPKSIIPFALMSVQAGSFIPLLFFLVDLLRVVLELLKTGENVEFTIIFYMSGLLLLSIAIIWNIVTFTRKYTSLDKQFSEEKKAAK